MKYLVDTDWVIDALVGRPPAAHVLRTFETRDIAVSVVTLGELYHGAYDAPVPAAEIARYRGFLAGWQLLTITVEIAERFALLRSTLKRQGTPIGSLMCSSPPPRSRTILR